MRQDEQQLNNDHPEAVRSAPVAVPPNGAHRDVPDDPDRTDEPTDRDRVESTDRNRPWDGRPRDDEGGEVTEPAPVPTAFGATSVGGAVAASAMASPRPEDEIDPRAERTARPGDGAVDGEREGLRADPTAEFGRTGDDLDDTDTAVEVEPAGHRADNLDGRAEPLTPGGETERTSTVDTTDAAAAGGPGYGSAAPTMVDPDGPSPSGDSDTTGSSVLAGAATLFDGATAQGFRDRWRDVQLRFVDDPQAAAGQAQSLVDEAMQALSTALAEHKNKLGGWQEAGSPDTEQLRVAVREYRDFLDRVLGR
ncbi:hypothetical protein [Micromonospora craniellae]|uniref:Uncharacterized protein n=1 Tax=Micromonospora craniellae TaxID=2294034 RepID=A0A372G5K6_9ACTN|nr:hypothetical protein [Micromonospora craniellae]QOC90609.1 hypothetical protein ID554_20950 [Micromonospora craniellae]RFS48010.1 hypothetical protein D0Q02_00405 [Micromonospora craniellae]